MKKEDRLKALLYTEGYKVGRQEVKKEALLKIKKVKEAVRKQTGSFKYDDCYDDCIKIINNIK